jgi:hypothetical protein
VDGLIAPAVIDGSIDGASFHACVEQVLAPTLKAGNIAILDNASCHQLPAVRHVNRIGNVGGRVV